MYDESVLRLKNIKIFAINQQRIFHFLFEG